PRVCAQSLARMKDRISSKTTPPIRTPPAAYSQDVGRRSQDFDPGGSSTASQGSAAMNWMSTSKTLIAKRSSMGVVMANIESTFGSVRYAEARLPGRRLLAYCGPLDEAGHFPCHGRQE